MRHKTQKEESTHLLLQKPVGYAELEENARIALSVLGDDGWKVSRIDVDMRIQVFAEPIIQEREFAEHQAALEQAKAKFILVREEVLAAHSDQWMAMAMAFFLAAGVHWLGAGAWIGLGTPVCVGCYIVSLKLNRKKGVA